MELTDRDVALVVLIALVSYPLFVFVYIGKPFFQEGKIFADIVVDAFKRLFLSVFFYLFILLALQLINDYTEYKVLELLPSVWRELLTQIK
jgi:hypothetical protein